MKISIRFKKWLRAFFVALLLAVLLRSVACQSFTIYSSSMKNKLQPGDCVVVEKLSYGARLPSTPLAIPFFHQRLPLGGLPSYSRAIELPYKRLPGFSGVQRLDFLVFNSPFEGKTPVSRRTRLVKRCIALPGDSLRIEEGKIRVNSQPLGWNGARFKHRIIANLPSNLQFRTGNLHGIYEGFLSEKEKELLIRKGLIRKALLLPEVPSLRIKIPKKGDTLVLSRPMRQLFAKAGFFAQKTGAKQGEKAASYVFEQDYYFVMNDNRAFSDRHDCLLVPESHLIGRVAAVWFSRSPGKVAWGRIGRLQ